MRNRQLAGLSSSKWLVKTFLLLMMLALSFAPPATGQSGQKWSFVVGNDPDNRGRSVARLAYGVPETDDQQAAAVCEARSGSSVSFSSLTLAADTGNLKNDARVRVRFSGGGQEHELTGTVIGVGNTNEAISGVIVRPKHDDALWSMLMGKQRVDYSIRGYASNSLKLDQAGQKIAAFVAACKSYEKALSRKPAQSFASGEITEKEAFDIAKELGTVEGWQAFLKKFSSGFRADLARAYVKRLSRSDRTASATSSPAPTATPTNRPRSVPVVKPTLSTVSRGPASSRWVNRTERMRIAGEQSVYTASVRVPGAELVTYCVESAAGGGLGLGAIVRKKGSYPSFSERIRQGLAARPALAGGPNREIEVTFSNGEFVDDAAATPSIINGELQIGPNADAFGADSAALAYLMSESSVTVALEPFRATFQLRGSRKAICAVMNRCGASVPGCGGGSSVVPASRPVTTSRCSGGRYFSRSKGRCVCPSGRSYWNGRSCERLRCGKNYKLVRGECVLLQNCGRNAYRSPEGDCYCNKGFRRTNSGRCVRAKRRVPNCGPNAYYIPARGRCFCSSGAMRWNGRRCVPKRRQPNCTGGRVFDNQVRRCVCPGDSSWNGRRCFKQSGPAPRGNNNNNNNNAKKAVCAAFQLGCAAGSQGACRSFAQKCQ